MFSAIIENDVITLVPIAPLVITPNTFFLQIKSGYSLQVFKKRVAILSDMVSYQPDVSYVFPPFVTPGSGKLVFDWKEISSTTTKEYKPVLYTTGNPTGTWTLVVTTPAMNPQGIPDAIPHIGNFYITPSHSSMYII